MIFYIYNFLSLKYKQSYPPFIVKDSPEPPSWGKALGVRW